jgi:hypothetical protein
VLHVPGQLIPATLLVTVPLPIPASVTFKGGLMATSSRMRGIVRVVLGIVIGLPVVVKILRISSTPAREPGGAQRAGGAARWTGSREADRALTPVQTKGMLLGISVSYFGAGSFGG